MPHIVNRRGYLSLEESFRDEQGRPRKRTLIYYGKSDPRRDRMLATAERKAEEWDAYQRETFGETAAERRSREEAERQFTPEKFFEKTAAEPSAEPQSPADGIESTEGQSPDPDASSAEAPSGPSEGESGQS